jgi:hypothetical protein
MARRLGEEGRWKQFEFLEMRVQVGVASYSNKHTNGAVLNASSIIM